MIFAETATKLRNYLTMNNLTDVGYKLNFVPEPPRFECLFCYGPCAVLNLKAVKVLTVRLTYNGANWAGSILSS